MNIIKKLYEKIDRYVPRISQVLFLLALLAGGIHLAVLNSLPFADWFNRWISPVFRGFLAKATNLLPCSLAETILITLPLSLTVLICFAVVLMAFSTAERTSSSLVNSLLRESPCAPFLPQRPPTVTL